MLGMRSVRLRLLGVLGVVAALSGGCVPSLPSQSPTPTVPKEHVRAAWVAISGSQSPAWIAQEAGYFAKYGLDVELSFIEGSARATAALLSGNVDILEQAGPAAVAAVKQGGDVTMIAGCLNTSVFKLMSSKDIQTPVDLKGKTIAITSFGTSDEFLLRRVLSSNGLDPATDVTVVQARDAAGQVSVLTSGQVQAVMLSPPNDLVAQKQGAKLLVDTVPLKLAYQATGVATSRSYLSKHRAAAVSFVKAISDAIQRFKTDPAYAKQVMQTYLKIEDPEILDATWKGYAAAFEDVPYPSVAGIQEILDETGDKDRTPAEFLDSSVVKEIEDSGFFKR
jgi:NitT/TauT family transport system substrate-binding protein